MSALFSFASAMASSASLSVPEEQLVASYHLTNMLWTGSYVVLFYDYLLTFDDEMCYIWVGKWGRGRILYLMDRYWPLLNAIPSFLSVNLHNPSTAFCTFCFIWFTFSNLIVQFITTLIIILRIYAIYESHKTLLYGLVTWQISILTLQGGMTFFMFGGSEFTPVSHPTGCFPGHWILRPWILGLPAAVLDWTLFFFVANKFVQLRLRRETGVPPTLVLMLKDSLLYFAALFGVIAANFVAWGVGGVSLFVALPQTLIVTHSIIGCRMLLNVKKSLQPWRGEPWRDEDSAVFSAIVKSLSYFDDNAAARRTLPELQYDEISL